MYDTHNDNDGTHARPDYRGPDPHGQAALLLVESLIHGLVARSLLSAADAAEIVEIAAEVKQEVATDLGDSPGTLRKSLMLLSSIAETFKIDAK